MLPSSDSLFSSNAIPVVLSLDLESGECFLLVEKKSRSRNTAGELVSIDVCKHVAMATWRIGNLHIRTKRKSFVDAVAVVRKKRSFLFSWFDFIFKWPSNPHCDRGLNFNFSLNFLLFQFTRKSSSTLTATPILVPIITDPNTDLTIIKKSLHFLISWTKKERSMTCEIRSPKHFLLPKTNFFRK